MSDGRIRSAEVQEVFSSPSAWALRCKKIVNPDQKYGCGWSSVSNSKYLFITINENRIVENCNDYLFQMSKKSTNFQINFNLCMVESLV